MCLKSRRCVHFTSDIPKIGHQPLLPRLPQRNGRYENEFAFHVPKHNCCHLFPPTGSAVSPAPAAALCALPVRPRPLRGSARAIPAHSRAVPDALTGLASGPGHIPGYVPGNVPGHFPGQVPGHVPGTSQVGPGGGSGGACAAAARARRGAGRADAGAVLTERPARPGPARPRGRWRPRGRPGGARGDAARHRRGCRRRRGRRGVAAGAAVQLAGHQGLAAGALRLPLLQRAPQRRALRGGQGQRPRRRGGAPRARAAAHPRPPVRAGRRQRRVRRDVQRRHGHHLGRDRAARRGARRLPGAPQARLFDEPQLASLCLDTIDKSTMDAISAEGFTDIDIDTLCAVLERDTLSIRESRLFGAVVRWAEAECQRQQLPVTFGNKQKVLGRALSLIRFPLMTIEEFAAGPAQSGILSDREVVNLFLHFTVNPKPKVDYIDRPRCCLRGKECSINRFQQVESRWGYSGTSDRIRFTVNRRISIVGFGLYGSIHGPTDYQVNIQIIDYEKNQTLGQNDTGFSCDGTASTFRVMFKEPIEILPTVCYTACATLKGPDSHYGTKGLKKVIHESPTASKTCFVFYSSPGNNNGTSIEDGQIPEIIFYT
uniref:BTB domain containing 1 n=1 Tax=Taeniopygia guttata TaxID=59729 RepID=A0A674G7A6_TAEGU